MKINRALMLEFLNMLRPFFRSLFALGTLACATCPPRRSSAISRYRATILMQINTCLQNRKAATEKP